VSSRFDLFEVALTPLKRLSRLFALFWGGGDLLSGAFTGVYFVCEGLRFLAGVRSLTFEEELARYFSRFGPFVAIGRPGERLPTLGALRLYVAHDEWQARVSRLVEDAQFIVWHAGETEGTWWELNHLVKAANPLKLLLVAPPLPVPKRFVDRANDILPCGVPPLWTGRLIAFNANWEPTAVPLKYGSLWRLIFGTGVLDVEVTFSTIGDRFGSAFQEALHSSPPLLAAAGALKPYRYRKPDGAELGPFTLQEMRALRRDGTTDDRTLILRQGTDAVWMPQSQFAELRLD
jgi:hypothetical protein